MKKSIKLSACAVIIAVVLAVGIAAFAAPSPKAEDDAFLPDVSNIYIVDERGKEVCELPVDSAELIPMHKTDRLTKHEKEIIDEAFESAVNEKDPVLYFFWMDLDRISLGENESVKIIFSIPGVNEDSHILFKLNGVHIGDDNVIPGEGTVSVTVKYSGAAAIIEIKDEIHAVG